MSRFFHISCLYCYRLLENSNFLFINSITAFFRMKYVELWLRRKRTITRLLIAGLIIAFTCEVYYFFSYWFSKEELREHYEMCDKFPSEFSNKELLID